MGNSVLYQKVSAEWVLKELFVEMRFASVRVGENGNPDYEAIYLIGHDDKRNEYILHLFDTFGVTSRPTPGLGIRENNSIRFRFDYEAGIWYNTFTWLPASKAWKNTITYEQEGKELTFAEKELLPTK